MDNYLIVITGPTGVGKSDLCIALAQSLSAHIVSCDSRQLYSEMRIGTAVPSIEQLGAVPHHFIQSRSVCEPYSAGDYESDAIKLLEQLFTSNSSVMMVGGTGLYIDAVTKGFDDMPEVCEMVRQELRSRVAQGQYSQLVEELRVLDSEYYNSVDINNTQRVVRALEVIKSSGQPFSSFRRQGTKERNFKVIKIAITRDREELYNRINQRVDSMVNDGLVAEATSLYSYRALNALNSVGYQEIFSYLDGDITLHEAIELIKRNSRRYAKRQLTWLRRDSDVIWLDASQFEQLCSKVDSLNSLLDYLKL